MDNLITEIELPDSLEKIGKYALKKNNIQEIDLPNTLLRIGEGAFENNKLTQLIIGDTVSTIGERAFKQNNLSSLVLSANIKLIPKGAFNRNQLESVEIPENILKIGENAFKNNKISSVNIPDNVASIERGAFARNDLYRLSINQNTTFHADAFPETALIDFKGINDAPKEIVLSSLTVDENIARNSVIAEISTRDPDPTDSHIYELSDSIEGLSDNGNFSIDGNKLTIISSPDFLNQNFYAVRIKSTDAGGLAAEETFILL